jgi:ABC-type transport system substrate-binding protein
VKPKGTLRVVDLFTLSISVKTNYAEGLVTLDKDNNRVPCLAEDWRWMDDRTVEFKRREGVRLHNGEKFKVNSIGPLDTLKAVESLCAQVAKSRICSASV